MRKMIRKGERASAKDFLNCFVLPIAEAKARKEFDELMKKYGKKSGSGYVMSIEDLLKICDELERKEKEEKKIKESNWGILGRQVLECPDCGNKKVQVEITEEGIVIKCNQCGYGITKEDVKDFEERVKKINEKEKTIEILEMWR